VEFLAALPRNAARKVEIDLLKRRLAGGAREDPPGGRRSLAASKAARDR
jgi:hypothetical protein